MTTTAQLTIRRSEDRGQADHGWLRAKHSFSFGSYHDPAQMGFGPLRVLNDDKIAGGGGFPTHPHSNMEIFTYMLAGELQHQDSIGNGRTIRTGEFQYMSAGSGVQHSEKNASSEDPVQLLQIWLSPKQNNTQPRYQHLHPAELESRHGFTLLASPDGKYGSISILQDAAIYLAQLQSGSSYSIPDTAQRNGHYLHLIKGEIKLDSHTLKPGDAAHSVGDFPTILAPNEAQFLYFNL